MASPNTFTSFPWYWFTIRAAQANCSQLRYEILHAIKESKKYLKRQSQQRKPCLNVDILQSCWVWRKIWFMSSRRYNWVMNIMRHPELSWKPSFCSNKQDDFSSQNTEARSRSLVSVCLCFCWIFIEDSKVRPRDVSAYMSETHQLTSLVLQRTWQEASDVGCKGFLILSCATNSAFRYKIMRTPYIVIWICPGPIGYGSNFPHFHFYSCCDTRAWVLTKERIWGWHSKQ